ncbi:MAG TPA: ABC transporter substrate-binding protein [Stellaceae bacterium]|nr:ABC transporter substrate-binding protein [Stellaceae bacterium]
MRRAAIQAGALCAVAAALALGPQAACALDRVTFGTDWKAEAEHGGYYQAIAAGIYAKHGIEVVLRQGGPQVNQSQLLAAGRIDFSIASNSFIPLNFAKNAIPMVAVAALFQKDPAVLIAHKGVGNDSLPALKGKPIMLGGDTRVGWWLYLKAKYGYTDDQIRTYDFSVAPFLANKDAVQQGYLTSEPFIIEKAGVSPNVFLIADAGYASYASIIEGSQKMARDNPDLVQRFVDACIEGWYSYIYGDPKPGNDLIKKDNPEQSDELLAYAIAKMKEYGVVDSGASLKDGIGAMSEERWKSFFDVMVGQGLYPKDMDYRQAYTLRFVNRAVGMELKK